MSRDKDSLNRLILLPAGALITLLVATGSVVGASPELVAVRVPAALKLDDATCEGCQVVLLTPHGRSYRERLLTADFYAARDPAVSFDGRELLFAGRRTPADHWQIWRVGFDGEDAVRISAHDADSRSPISVGSLFHLDDEQPRARIVYLSTAHDTADEPLRGTGTALYAADRDGGHAQRITYNLGTDSDPEVLPNGRVLFASSRSIDGARQALMAVNIDGTDVMAYSDAHAGPRHRHSPRVGFDGSTYYIETDTPGPLGGGALAAVSQRRPLHSRRVVADTADGDYLSPLPLVDGGLMVSFRPTRPEGRYAIYRIDPESGRRGNLVYSSPDHHLIDGQERTRRPVAAGRASVVDDRLETGVFFCLSSHISDRPELDHHALETATGVRVIEGVPPPGGGAPAARRIVGQAPVEADGSFHIEVPAETPLLLQLLDGDGMAVASHERWIWVMPRESRGCIGCHENREMAPPNVLAEAVVEPAVQLTLPPGQRRFVDFNHEIAPIVAARCATGSCHSAGSAGSFDLESAAGRRDAFERVTAGVNPGSARTSPLIAHLLESDRSAGQPDTIERRLLVEWIDLGAAFDSRHRNSGAEP